ncbi:hypothetical protein QQS21_005534 [Conoideocrella luteorostrata]|uniref:Uncharacterized protein n=1 Tax=Conoideocrella luteorostrata TaxID=1105319 RepID=A0AAJ0FZ20_9HYPO|nr:hypothetical protein QQS21_005534 [Conoideocrella luteorostrata]
MPWKPPSGGSGHRPRTGSKSIRGQISGPIPIPNPLDEEFPIRGQQVAIATPTVISNMGEDDKEMGFGHQVVNLEPIAPHYASGSSGSGNSSCPNQPSDLSSSTPAPRSVSQKSSTRTPSQLRQSLPLSETESKKDKRDSQVKPQRKKSTIRSAFSKLFGRKKKTQAVEETKSSQRNIASANPKITPNKQHRSDPTGHRPNHITIEPKRSFSMPITEYDRALRSHSVGPEDVMAIQSARNSLSADMRMSGRFLHAFGSSDHPASPRWAGGSKLAGLSPRPASSQDRTRMGDLGDDPTEIGRAISSDSHGLKRRSRSLSVIPNLDLASTPQGIVRRRSAEIRYWRESYAAPFMSPTSTTADEEMMRLPMDDPGDEALPPPEERAVTPEQAIMMNREDTKGSPSPRKSTEETTSPIEPMTLDIRVSNLEMRMSRLEGIVLQLGSSLPALRLQSSNQNRPSGARSVHLQTNDHSVNSILLQPSDMGYVGEPRRSTSRPSTRHSDVSKKTFGDVDEATPRATIVSPIDSESRAYLQSTQLRGTGGPLRHSSGAVTFEHYTNLLALLETERSAREALEAHVRSLSRQVQLIGKSTAYTNTDQSDSPSLDRSLGEVSVFDHDEDDDNHHRRITATRCRYNTLGTDDSGIATENRSDDEYTESFVTPVEIGNSGFDVYGNENDAMLRSEGRKLSLSHLTMRQPLATMPQVPTNAI